MYIYMEYIGMFNTLPIDDQNFEKSAGSIGPFQDD